MKKSSFPFAMILLLAIFLTGMILEVTLPANLVYAAQSAVKDGPAETQPEPGRSAVPIGEMPPVLQLFVGLVCAFLLVLGVIPIFLVDSDNRIAHRPF